MEPMSTLPIKAIDTPNTNVDASRRMITRVSRNARPWVSSYLCNRYNHRTNRQYVSKCRTAKTQGRNYVRTTCAYREPCSEEPSGCSRQAA